jgi:hypothetical protein
MRDVSMKPEIPAVTYFCLCGAAWHTLEDLKAHQTESRHSPTWSPIPYAAYAPADPLSPMALDDPAEDHTNCPTCAGPGHIAVLPPADPMNDGTLTDRAPDLHWARASAIAADDPAVIAAWKAANPVSLPDEVPAPDITLDPTDPFDAAVAEIVKINRRKRADYSLTDGGDVFSNFRQTSEVIAVEGFGPADSALFNVIQKVMRLRSLRANGRMDDPANEATADTYLDLATYSVIALALSREA